MAMIAAAKHGRAGPSEWNGGFRSQGRWPFLIFWTGTSPEEFLPAGLRVPDNPIGIG